MQPKRERERDREGHREREREKIKILHSPGFVRRVVVISIILSVQDERCEINFNFDFEQFILFQKFQKSYVALSTQKENREKSGYKRNITHARRVDIHIEKEKERADQLFPLQTFFVFFFVQNSKFKINYPRVAVERLLDGVLGGGVELKLHVRRSDGLSTRVGGSSCEAQYYLLIIKNNIIVSGIFFFFFFFFVPSRCCWQV